MMKCENCKYFFYDSSVGISECGQYDNMTEEETDKYYVEGEANCPYWKEVVLCQDLVQVKMRFSSS